jgi:hypothetical protein
MHSRQDMSFIGLNFHSAAAAISLLSTPELVIDEFLIDPQACGQARQESNQGLAVGLPGSEVTEHKHLILNDSSAKIGRAVCGKIKKVPS